MQVEAGSADGEPRRIRANPASALFNELTAIFEKTGGVVGEMMRVLSPLAHQIYFAVLYGSAAKQSDRATSDIDVLIVTDELTLEQVFAATERAEKHLARTVSPTLYAAAEFHRRRKAKHPFLTKVLGGKTSSCSEAKMPSPLDNLAAVGQLKVEPPVQQEIDGLLRSGAVRIADAEKDGNRVSRVASLSRTTRRTRSPWPPFDIAAIAQTIATSCFRCCLTLSDRPTRSGGCSIQPTRSGT